MSQSGKIAAFVLAGIIPSFPFVFGQDLAELQRKAESGHAAAQYNLGVMYTEGQGVPQNYPEAIRWYRKAAKQGDALAQNYLGVSYESGQGVPQDYREAVRRYKKAANE